jgi:hypothetical protein
MDVSDGDVSASTPTAPSAKEVDSAELFYTPFLNPDAAVEFARFAAESANHHVGSSASASDSSTIATKKDS